MYDAVDWTAVRAELYSYVRHTHTCSGIIQHDDAFMARRN